MSSQLYELDLGSLKELDGGKINAAFSKHLQRASQDCQDRPFDERPRIVTLRVAFKPTIEPDGDCASAWMDVKLESKIPNHQSKPYSVGLRRNNTFVFAEDSLDNVDQATFDYGDND